MPATRDISKKLGSGFIKNCPKCEGRGGCRDTRALSDGRIRRRYECLKCKQRWSTVEERFKGSSLGGQPTKAFDEQQRKKFRREFQTELRTILGFVPAKRKNGSAVKR
jgi:transcriptional regulator NrdR family protein